MKISQISIKNYRQFKDISINLSNLLIIIGENNSGKTNLLRALNIVLNPERSYKKVTITPEDFFNIKLPIIIEITFEDLDGEDEFLPSKSYDPDDGFLIIRYIAKWNKITDEADIKCVFYHEDIAEDDQVDFFFKIKKHFPLFIIDSERQPHKELSNKSGTMQKLLGSFLIDLIRPEEIYIENIKHIWEELINKIRDISSDTHIDESIFNSKTYTEFLVQMDIPKLENNHKQISKTLKNLIFSPKLRIEKGEIKEIKNLQNKLMNNILNFKKKIEFNDHVDNLRNNIENIQGFSDFSNNLEKIITTILPQIDFNFSLLPLKKKELIRNVQVNINDFDFFKHGTGLQSNFIICLKILGMIHFMKSKGVKSGYIAIEEPENHIYPHLQRSFIRNIQDIKSYYPELNIQFLITTHSPNIIKFQNPESLAIMHIDKNSTSISQYSSDYYTQISKNIQGISTQKKLKIENQMKKTLKVIFYHYPEIFFAKSVIIAEGYTEEGAFPEFAGKMDMDFDSRGVSCINGLGKDFLVHFRRLIEYINIPVVCVYDKDDGTFTPPGLVSTNFITNEKDFEREIIKNIPASKIIKALEAVGNKSENKKLLNSLKGIDSKIPRSYNFVNLVRYYDKNPTLDRKTEESFAHFLGDNKNSAFGYSIGEIIEKSEIPQIYKDAIKKVIKLAKR